MDHAELAADLLKLATTHGADAADLLIAEGTEFSVSVRRGKVETLKDAGSKALGIRVFFGKRTATAHTSDFSKAALEGFVRDAVDMARVTGEDETAGLPDEMVPAEEIELRIHDPSAATLPTDQRIEMARRAEAVALETPGITNSHGSSYGFGEGRVLLANSLGFVGSYRSSSCSLSVVPIAERDGLMERDYWYTMGHGPGELSSPWVESPPNGRCAGSGPARSRPARCP